MPNAPRTFWVPVTEPQAAVLRAVVGAITKGAIPSLTERDITLAVAVIGEIGIAERGGRGEGLEDLG